jgi:hypothetical protein
LRKNWGRLNLTEENPSEEMISIELTVVARQNTAVQGSGDKVEEVDFGWLYGEAVVYTISDTGVMYPDRKVACEGFHLMLTNVVISVLKISRHCKPALRKEELGSDSRQPRSNAIVENV